MKYGPGAGFEGLRAWNICMENGFYFHPRNFKCIFVIPSAPFSCSACAHLSFLSSSSSFFTSMINTLANIEISHTKHSMHRRWLQMNMGTTWYESEREKNECPIEWIVHWNSKRTSCYISFTVYFLRVSIHRLHLTSYTEQRLRWEAFQFYMCLIFLLSFRLFLFNALHYSFHWNYPLCHWLFGDQLLTYAVIIAIVSSNFEYRSC